MDIFLGNNGEGKIYKALRTSGSGSGNWVWMKSWNDIRDVGIFSQCYTENLFVIIKSTDNVEIFLAPMISKIDDVISDVSWQCELWYRLWYVIYLNFVFKE